LRFFFQKEIDDVAQFPTRLIWNDEIWKEKTPKKIHYGQPESALQTFNSGNQGQTSLDYPTKLVAYIIRLK
jgi:hypothetical protein